MSAGSAALVAVSEEGQEEEDEKREDMFERHRGNDADNSTGTTTTYFTCSFARRKAWTSISNKYIEST